MILSEINFSQYKAFKKAQKFVLKPITIIVGKNSSGKSAVARLPLLISQAFNNNSDEPIKMQFDGVEFGGSFTDLIYNRFSHGSLSMSLKFSENLQIDFEIQNIADTPLQVVKSWTMTSSQINLSMDMIFERQNVLNTAERLYNINGEMLKVRFRGLFPERISKENGDAILFNHLDAYEDALNYFSNTLEYIGPLREPAHRSYPYSGSVPKNLGFKGEFAPQILGMSTFVDEELVANVGKWFKEHLGYELSVYKEIKSFEIVLVNPHNSSIEVNIADVGQGISQVLPLIVRCFDPKYHNSITIIEQPELHLHPAAHGDLAELFAITAIRESSNFIIETHSENIILRLRRMVTENRIKPDDVIIYWTDDDEDEGSSIQPITIDDDGSLSQWPEGVFSEDYLEVLAINSALRSQKK